MKYPIFALAMIFSTTAVWSNDARVVDVSAEQRGGTWTFSVTLEHGDTGWDHYADGWGVYSLDGTELGYRVLAHPHVNEQPFTRSLSGVLIPKNLDTVIIVPKDSVHGEGARFEYKLVR